MTIVVIVIAIALVFDYINGFHDAANSIATVVSTRVLTPGQAVLWAAFFNFVAAFGFGTGVAKTIGSGMIDISIVTSYVILAGLIGAIVWDLLTWWVGLPTSSSHALIGAYAGAAIAKSGTITVLVAAGWIKTLLFIVLSPLIGMVLGFVMMLGVSWLVRKRSPFTVDKWFRRGQLFSAAAYSLGHGTNDAQKTMGIIAGVLFANGMISSFEIPMWVILAAHAAIGLGTLTGGWRIVKTMGMRITALKPVGGFSAETAAAVTLLGSAAAGIPVSTTHTITGAIVGVGSLKRPSAVRWGVATRIVWAWLLTIPASAAIAGGAYYLFEFFGFK
ncbi:MAG TPA: inorganic phosphate transporter [Candidatus Kapabacteria bacterium]|nr:inorganic phosphate transporter [Candidatus Kapabacteria bacterium]